MVMNKGQIVASGSPKKVLKDRQLMDSAGLEIPFVLAVQEELNKHNKKIKEVDNIDELVEALWQLK